MTVQEVKDYAESCDKNVLMFSNPDYASAIIGISSDDRVIYDYDKMVEDLMQTEEFSEIDAIEFINYNTLRSLAYYDNAPVVLQIKNYYK